MISTSEAELWLADEWVVTGTENGWPTNYRAPSGYVHTHDKAVKIAKMCAWGGVRLSDVVSADLMFAVVSRLDQV